MDLTKARPFRDGRLSTTKRGLADQELSIVCLGSSCRLHESETLSQNVEEGKRYIDLAAELGSPFIRVFGDRIPEGAVRDRVIDQVAEGLVELGRYAEGTEVQVLIESHGDFSRSDDLIEVMRKVDHPNVGVLWDAHHPYRFFGESVEDTYNKLKEFTKHIHVKDSVPTRDGCLYRLLGQGDFPVRELVHLLESDGYGGWISFEWEKHWHPELEEPEVALPAFVDTFRAQEAKT